MSTRHALGNELGISVLLLALGLAACAQTAGGELASDDRLDGENDVFLGPDGKLDGGRSGELTDCSVDALAVLSLANTASLARLDGEVHLHRYAARNIVAARDIAQGSGLETLAELDAVAWVGPWALQQMLTYTLLHPDAVDWALVDALARANGCTADDSEPDASAVLCAEGQVAEGGACVFTCDGVSVPGDYATLGDAVTALAESGRTICLAPGRHAFSGDVYGVTIIGPSADRVTLVGNLENVGSAILRGFTVTGRVRVSHASESTNTELRGLRIGGGLDLDTDATHFARRHAQSVLVDGCDIRNPEGAAVALADTGTTIPQGYPEPITFRIQNSYLHDSEIGASISIAVLWLPSYDDRYLNVAVSLVNNTIVGNDVGIDAVVAAYRTYRNRVELTWANNVLANNNVALRRDIATGREVFPVQVANAFSDNGLSYAGLAVPGEGEVRGAGLLDLAATPPAPRPDSALIDGADGALAPAHDFFGRVRGARPELGAVEVL